jgi:DeoR family transcriptional regulator, aga operon transcriptional repressor
MVKQAREVIIVADSSKIGMVSPAVICSARDIDQLITDDGIAEETASALEVSGIRITRV